MREPAGLGVLDERLVQPRLQRVGAVDDRLDRLSGITVANTPPKNAHAASNPAITSSMVWRKRQPHEAVPRSTAVKINA